MFKVLHDTGYGRSKSDVIFTPNNRYKNITVTTTGLTRLPLATGAGPKYNFPQTTPNKTTFFAEFLEALITDFVFSS